MELNNFTFKARIPEKYKDELNRLFYFNNNQSKYAKQIIRSVELYGKPVLVTINGLISLELKSENKGQSLFMLNNSGEEESLIGVLLYSRISRRTMVIVHLAMLEDASQVPGDQFVSPAYFFIQQFISIASKLKDVNEIILPYSFKKIRIKK